LFKVGVNMTTTTNSAEDIQAQMRQVRCELGEDVAGFVEGARDLTDWKRYVRMYPWACVGVAAAAGFLMVPQRAQVVRPDPGQMAELAKAKKIEVNTGAKAKTGIVAAIAATATNALMQAGMAYAKGHLSSFLDGQLHRQSTPAAAKSGDWRDQ
jgi:hypothetical protein